MEIREHIDASKFSTMCIGGTVRYMTSLERVEDIGWLLSFAHDQGVVPHMIGGGSNTVFADGELAILLVKNNLKGIQIVSHNIDGVEVRVMAGEVWSKFVLWAVEHNLAGIEALAAIPGLVGASPVQNIGAYGQEISQVIQSVDAFDTQEEKFVSFTNSQCDFAYRSSIFKQYPQRYWILSITVSLVENSFPGIPPYKTAEEYFKEKGITNPNLEQIVDGITNIRWNKLPRPEDLPNCGSWFKNPVVELEVLKKVQEKYPEVPNWPVDNNLVKISAGWLVEHAVGKGWCNGSFCTYDKQALVLTNPERNSSYKDFARFEGEIKETVKEQFSITLEREPILIR